MNQQERIRAHEQRQKRQRKEKQEREEQERRQRQEARRKKAAKERRTSVKERDVKTKAVQNTEEISNQKTVRKKQGNTERRAVPFDKRISYSPEDAADQFHRTRQKAEENSKLWKPQMEKADQKKKINEETRRRIQREESQRRKNQKKEPSMTEKIAGAVQKEMFSAKRAGNRLWESRKRFGKQIEITVMVCGMFLILILGGNAIKGLGKTISESGGNAQNKNPIRDMIDLMKFGNNGGDASTDAPETDFSEPSTQAASLDQSTEPSTAESPNTAVGVTGNYTLATAGGLVVDISRILCPTWIDRQYLTVSPYSRPGVNMDSIQFIAIHYVGNPGTTAQNNRNYFEKLKDDQQESRSSHFIVGLDGEVIQCIPLNEKSYATNERNIDTISIEVCHPDETGQFNQTTYNAVVKLTAWLCEQFGLTEENVIRHYDVTGKICPKYYVEHPEAWTQMKKDIADYMTQHPDIE